MDSYCRRSVYCDRVLLEMTMKQLALDFPAARTTDPSTSHRAAESLKPGSQQYQLLHAYAKHPLLGMTDEEAGKETGLDQLPRCCYWKRCSELRAAGYIQTADAERPSTAGKMQLVSYITAQGMKALQQVSG